MSKKKFYLANSATLEISEEYIDDNSKYFEYSTPWRFSNIDEAKEYLKENLKRKIKAIDNKIEDLQMKRDDLVNKLFNI